jgi:metal-dependent amidase/aminoacylase/carboxypeptidase family protein
VVAGLTALTLPQKPRTTLSVGRWSGGTSGNAIPQEAWVELEVRSEAPPELDRLAAEIRSGAPRGGRGGQPHRQWPRTS